MALSPYGRFGFVSSRKSLPRGLRWSCRDAILYAVGANASHGLKRTNRDKRNAVLLLKDLEWGRRQDVRTADQIAAALALIRQSDEPWHGLAVAQRHGPRRRTARPFGGAGDTDGAG
jgi:hypothetical protein